MINRGRKAATGVAMLVLTIAGCSTGDDPGSGATTPNTPPSQTTSAVERAEAALMTSAELPPAPPGTIVDAGLGYTAVGDQVSAPWAQVWLCAGTSRPDEGPPTAAEPGAAAGAWGFGRAGVAQVDQYAIVYEDEASAQAAVARAQAQVDMCTDAITGNPEYVGDPPAIEVGTVPSSVDGLRVRALFTYDTGKSNDMVSTVLRSGTTVHYMRFNEMSATESAPGETEQNPDTMLDPTYIDTLIAEAAANLTR
jgi:hypothetical protein